VTDVPLFELPEQPPLRKPNKPQQAIGLVEWSDYNPKFRVKCDDCLALTLEALQAGAPLPPLARQARHTMKVDRLLVAHLCSEHKQLREQDT
jgi:hypothetical protein